MRNYISEGEKLTWTNGGTAVVSGQVVAVGATIGIATGAIANGATGELAVCGVFDVPKLSTAVITQGMPLMWDASAANFDVGSAVAATGDIKGAAIAVAAAGNGTTTVRISLQNRIGTVT